MRDASFLGFTFDGRETIAKIVDAITDSVAISYALEGGRRTDAEDMDRTNKAIELIRIMRGDMKWSVRRIVDELPNALRVRVRGEHWEPAAGRSWAGR